MKRGTTSLAGLAVAVLALAACGDDDNDPAIPDLSLPNVTVPDLTLPNLSLPNLSLPDLSLPNLSLPDLTLPDVSIPAFEEIMQRVQDLPPDQLACIVENAGDLSATDLDAATAVFEQCGVDVSELTGG